MNTKHQGDTAELRVALDCQVRGYVVSVPFGDNAPYDLLVHRNEKIERLQVKSRTPTNGVINIELFTMQHDSRKKYNNRTRQKFYDSTQIDWYAVVDVSTNTIYYVNAKEVDGLSAFRLRLTPPKNSRANVRLAENYKHF